MDEIGDSGKINGGHGPDYFLSRLGLLFYVKGYEDIAVAKVKAAVGNRRVSPMLMTAPGYLK